MKIRKLILVMSMLFLLLSAKSPVLAQRMMGGETRIPIDVASDDHTATEEAEGREIWNKLQSNELDCDNLTEGNFQALGEYAMGLSIGNTKRHALMNQMMANMMGEEGEKQMHVTLGKRYSGCDSSASYPQKDVGFMPMMWMMGGGGNPMMGGWGSFGLLGGLSMLLLWILLLLGVVALVRYVGSSKRGNGDHY